MSEANGREDELRDARIGKILSDYADRRAAGEAESEAELLAAHPDLADDLRMHLDMLRNLGSGQARIDALIAQGILHRTSGPEYSAQLGPYRIKGFIGQGGMGIVLKAYEESLHRTVALKILRPDLAGDQAALARFTREAQAAAALRHPNIVTVHAVGEEHGVHFLAMEFVDGPSLRGFIREAGVGAPSLAQVAAGVPPAEVGNDAGAGWPTSLEVGDRFESTGAGAPSLAQQGVGDGLHSPTFDNAGHPSLPPETIRAIFRQLLSGLAVAHDAGLIHRDIKSSNILLDGWPPAVVTGVPPAEVGWPTSVAAGVSPAEVAWPPAVVTGVPPAEVGWPTSVEVGDRFESRDRTPRPEDPCHPSTQHSGLSTQHFVKIADFGLARMLSSKTRMTMTGSVLGTPEYMSPEQARGDTELDHRTDLYSAGVVLYEMLTGRTPFRADTPSAVIHQILHNDPPDPRTISPDTDPHLASLALRLMAKRPEDRFASSGDALTALDAGARVRSPERRRRVRRGMLVGLFAIALLAGGMWALSRFWRRPDTASITAEAKPSITRVWVDENVHTRILAEYGDDPTPRILYDFPPEAIRATATELVDLDGTGQRIVVAGIATPLHGDCLFAFDGGGAGMWRMNLSSETQWPDCGVPPRYFRCECLATADLDGEPGDEIVVVATDASYYPTRISVIDPRTGKIRSTFWHTGGLPNVRILPEFFDDQRPAILAWGRNNKLDGFDDIGGFNGGLRDDTEQSAHWDQVAAIMILDPNNMDGLGPPRTSRLPELPRARVYAYAFLDLACAFDVSYVSEEHAAETQASRREPTLDQTGYIAGIEGGQFRVADGTGPWFELTISASPKDGQGAKRVTLTVDRSLELRLVEPVNETTEPLAASEEYWRRYWRPIIQNGEFVRE